MGKKTIFSSFICLESLKVKKRNYLPSFGPDEKAKKVAILFTNYLILTQLYVNLMVQRNESKNQAIGHLLNKL